VPAVFCALALLCPAVLRLTCTRSRTELVLVHRATVVMPHVCMLAASSGRAPAPIASWRPRTSESKRSDARNTVHRIPLQAEALGVDSGAVCVLIHLRTHPSVYFFFFIRHFYVNIFWPIAIACNSRNCLLRICRLARCHVHPMSLSARVSQETRLDLC
jgi:hypothetical protein